MKDQVSILREKGVKAVVLGPDTSMTENDEASEGKYNLVFTSSEALFGSHFSTISALKSKIQVVFIDDVHCVAKWFVLGSVLFHKLIAALLYLPKLLKPRSWV